MQLCCDMLPQGAGTKKGLERKFVKKGRMLAEDDAGGVDHGRTLEVGIDTCCMIRPKFAAGKEKVERTCSAVIDAFDLSKIAADRRSARRPGGPIHSMKTSRQGRQEGRVMLHLLAKSPFAGA